MRNHNERGEGKITGLILLAAMAGLVYAAVHIGPTYVAHKNLQDEVTQIARMSIGYRDQVIKEKIQDAIDENELYDYISAKDFTIRKRANRRAIEGEFLRHPEGTTELGEDLLFQIHADEPTF